MSRHRNDCCFHVAAQMFFGSKLQLSENHCRDFLGTQFLRLSAPLNNNLRLSMSGTLNDLKWKTLGFLSNHGIIERTSNNTLHVIHCVARVGRHLRLSSHADQFALGGEGNPGRHGAA
mmetsp:Transcript_13245/g.28723  ORF Transcript_13245/g.28723 Transcript_13245/m.28723 type:complete len:118 (+) Transcript_13245:1488-1841(+)